MVAPISSLANMEMQLYGGFGSHSNAPSYLNGYVTNLNNNPYMNPAFYGYNAGYNQAFGQTIPSNYMQAGQAAQTAQSSVFEGLTQAERQALMEDYKKSLCPSEGLLACAAGNAVFSVINHPRLLVHPVNSVRALKATNDAFAAVKTEGSILNTLWKNPENSNILREAWFQHHKATARCESKLGAFRTGYVKSGDVDAIKNVLKNLENALQKGDMAAITKHTAELQHAYSVNNGFIASGYNYCKEGIKKGLNKIVPDSWTKAKSFLAPSKTQTIAEKLADTNGIQTRIDQLAKTSATLSAGGNAASKVTYRSILKRGGGVMGAVAFAGLELLLNAGKIKTAFEEDGSTGMKQLGQTLVKAAGNAGGWALGEAAGVWAFTKWGAKIGTKFGPGIGTLIGGMVGLIGGGLGMWLAGKVTKGVVGQDVADDIEAKKLAYSPEGQAQLLQNTMERIQKGEKVSPEAQQAISRVITQMA